MFKYLILFFTLSLLANNLFASNCIAHRGVVHNAVENSFNSINEAIGQSADGIEIDINHTKDGVGILIHDKNLKRVAMNKPGMNCPLKQKIRKLNFNVIKQNCMLKDGQEILKLSEVIQILKSDTPIAMLEFKDLPSEPTLKIIKEEFQGSPEQLRLIAFKSKIFKMLKNREDSGFWKRIKFFNLDLIPLKLYSSSQPHIWSVTYLLRKKYYQKLSGEVSVWTLNKPKDIDSAIKNGVDFILTDNLRACLK